MALLRANQVKTVQGATDLEITPNEGEAIIVKDIKIYNPSTSYITITIAQSTVGYWRVGGTLGNHLPFPVTDEEQGTLLAYLIAKDIYRPYPVAKGQKFKITGASQSGCVQVIVYDIYDEADVDKAAPNGSHATERDIVQYGQTSSAPGSGDTKYDNRINPGEFPDFPFEGTLPESKVAVLHGVCFSDVGKLASSPTRNQKSNFLKLVHNERFVWDEDLNGLPYIGSIPTSATTNIGVGQSMRGNYSDVDRRLPLLFDSPMTFDGAAKADFKINTTMSGASSALAVTDIEVALITSFKDV